MRKVVKIGNLGGLGAGF